MTYPSTVPALADLGPDDVNLIKRDLVPGELDEWGRPKRVESSLVRARCAVTVTDNHELVAGAEIAVLKLTALLPVDADTEALTEHDAAEFRGRRYELDSPAVRHDTLGGHPSHVRINGTWAVDMTLAEEVIVIAAGRRGDDGHFADDGPPVPVMARAVIPGNATRRFAGTGELVAADFTVVVPLDTAIADGDWLIVRGLDCRALVLEQENQWTSARELVVLAQSRAGV